MPTYEYVCKSCDRHLEVTQSFHDDPLTNCPTCDGELRKVFGTIGIAFKGSGFYRTDSQSTRRDPGRKDGGDSGTSSTDKSGDKPSDKSESSSSQSSTGATDKTTEKKSSDKSSSGGSSASKPGNTSAAS